VLHHASFAVRAVGIEPADGIPQRGAESMLSDQPGDTQAAAAIAARTRHIDVSDIRPDV
jgi:hypothetical protein